ncbi:gliding motility-associated C-terminal domain-containing protein [Chitinophaga sp. W3I9]|uniref:T9SS type B sorting domain-containing protein n=1 Tax=Chitinophaga sp. W3I9 TaxID=3373924 RepID=UPI003D253663
MLIHKGYSQDKIFVANGDDIGYIDLADFTYKFVASTPGFVDLAIAPGGKIYGIAGMALYEVNPVTGASTPITLTLNYPYFNGGHSMVSDRNGDLYVAGNSGAVYKIDMKTATLSFVGGTSLIAAGDLAFSDGKLYMIANGNILVEMVLGPGGTSILSERIVGPISVGGDIYSIAINENGICYVVSTSQDLALVDLQDATTYVISKPVKGPITSVWGAAMQQEGLNDKDIEICGNGLDDDHNGYLDDNDMACRLKRGVCNTDGQLIFREDFGNGAGFGPPLPGLGSGAYLFSRTAPLAEGYYTIVDNAATAQGNSTWKNMTDHSGQAGGRMLIVNGSYKPGEFYRKKMTGLCPGLQYAISVSACSVIAAAMFCGADISPIPSRIRFRIEDEFGKPLGLLAERYIPADPDPAAKWKEYGMMFTLPEGVTTIQIVMLDDAPGGCGNDLAVDDIVFSTCKPLQPVSINGGSTSYTGCQLTRATFKVDTTGLKLKQPVLQWQKLNTSSGNWEDISGAHDDTYTIEELLPADAGQYRIIMNENLTTSCRKEAVSVVATLQVSAGVSVKVTPAITVCMGSPLQLQAASNVVLAEVLWLGPDGYPYWEQAPLITNAATSANAGEYVMKATGTDGCIGAFTTQVTVAKIGPPDFTFAASLACAGKPVQVQASGNNLTGWQWNASGDHDISGAATATPAITWSAAGTYTLTLRATGQCVVDEPVTHSITVRGLPEPGHLQIPEQLCVGEPLTLAVPDATGTLSWRITGSPVMSGTDQKPIVTWKNPGTYTISYTVTGLCGSVDLPSLLPIIVRDLPSVSLINDTTICRGSQLTLQPVYSSNVVAFSWQHGPFVTESKYSAAKAGVYNVTVQDEWGCKNQDEVILQEKNCGCDIFIPTAFSPNGDGTNDIFRPVIHCVTASYQMRVYNRWGQLIFATQTPGVGWNGALPDGRKADIGTYTWLVEYKSSESSDQFRQTGAVTLVR